MEQNNNLDDDEMGAYNIILQRHLSDDRLIGERSTIFLASNSILFVGFVMLIQCQDAMVIRVIIPCLGFIWSILTVIANRRTLLGLDYWDKCEKKLEMEGQRFAFMRENKISPHLFYEMTKKRWFTWPRNRYIYAYFLPSLFIILWVSSLVWIILNWK